MESFKKSRENSVALGVGRVHVLKKHSCFWYVTGSSLALALAHRLDATSLDLLLHLRLAFCMKDLETSMKNRDEVCRASKNVSEICA